MSVRPLCAARWLLLPLALFSLSANPSFASDVILIEEHWELQVGGPDTSRSSPQVSMVMAPFSDLEQDFFLVTLNHWTHPEFAPGGIQVQRWLGDDCRANASSGSYNPLAYDEEVISWVQRLTLVDGELRFEVINGTSESWGAFGGDEELLLTHPTTLNNLNEYQPAVSINQSGIGYAGNRVSSLVLNRLRWQTEDGEEQEMVAPIDISTDINQ